MVKKRGRKKLPKKERLCEPIQVRLLPDELSDLEKEAEKTGLGRAVFVRMIVRQHLNRIRP